MARDSEISSPAVAYEERRWYRRKRSFRYTPVVALIIAGLAASSCSSTAISTHTRNSSLAASGSEPGAVSNRGRHAVLGPGLDLGGRGPPRR
ncbi:MAG: hypothetical protein ACYDEY_14375 [Acidimicrobiales bacterium]